jgi:hypothetical protein
MANDRGLMLARRSHDAAALSHFTEACRLAPDWYTPGFNLGVACKFTHDCEGAIATSLRAIELAPTNAGIGAHWTVGVAATALGEWEQARWAWGECGVYVPEGTGPSSVGFERVGVRLESEDGPHAVACRLLDPARARIANVPMPSTSRHYGDVLLIDGKDSRPFIENGRAYALYDELKLLERTDFATWEVHIVAPTRDDVTDLVAHFDGLNGAIADWSEVLPYSSESRQRRAPRRLVGLASVEQRTFQTSCARGQTLGPDAPCGVQRALRDRATGLPVAVPTTLQP